ncbi:hypothetical protein BH09MYX1_BH09MYX1_53690 [soil metagenome]
MTENKHQHLTRLLATFDTGFLMTQGLNGPHARPLAVARVEGPTVVWFLSSLISEKVQEILFDRSVLVTFQGGDAFVVVRGTASIVDDREALASLWSEPHRAWIPKGLDDETLVAIRVTVDHAEVWDQSGTKGVSYIAESLAASLGGTPPLDPKGRHEELHPSAGRP